MITPGPDGQGRTVDVVVASGAAFHHTLGDAGWDWLVTPDVRSDQLWNATHSPGSAPVPPAGTATITATRQGELTGGPDEGPHVSTHGTAMGVAATPDAPVVATLGVDDFQVAVLPSALGSFLGDGGGATIEKTDHLRIEAGRADGLRFKEGGVRLQRPVNPSLPGVTTRRSRWNWTRTRTDCCSGPPSPCWRNRPSCR